MKIIISFLLLVYLSSCDPPQTEISYFVPDKQSLADDVRIKVAKQLKEKELHLFGIGGQMMYEIQMLSLSFQYHKKINIEKARELLMLATDAMLNEINSNEAIRPYLVKYPFTSKNIEISIFLFKPDQTPWGLYELQLVEMDRGELIYKIRLSNVKSLRIQTETYEEAVEKLNNQKL